jgi:hypothetical protein
VSLPSPYTNEKMPVERAASTDGKERKEPAGTNAKNRKKAIDVPRLEIERSGGRGIFFAAAFPRHGPSPAVSPLPLPSFDGIFAWHFSE